MEILCTICARGGSKGVPNKNIRKLVDKPLIAWTIEQAIAWGKAKYVVVSTDSEEIAEIAIKYGAIVPFKRPEQLATDNAAKMPVIQHATAFMEKAEHTKFDYVIDLQPTSPLRLVEDIEMAFQSLLKKPEANNIYSACEASSSPYFNMVEQTNEGYVVLSKHTPEAIIRRQDAPSVYEMNGSIYVYKRDYLLKTESVHSEKTLLYLMPKDRSVDIDSELDFRIVELLMK